MKMTIISAALALTLFAEEKKPDSKVLTAEIKASIAVANTKLVNARLREAERKQQIQIQAQQAITELAQARQAAEQEYQATITRLLKPLGLEGCTVTEEAEIGECAPKEPKGAKPAK